MELKKLKNTNLTPFYEFAPFINKGKNKFFPKISITVNNTNNPIPNTINILRQYITIKISTI